MATEAPTKPARPNSRNEAALRIAAASLAKIVSRDWDVDGFSDEEIAADLLKAITKSFPMDGYAIAKSLEDYCGWDPDAALVEILDGASWEVDGARDGLIAEWVLQNNVIVPFAVGDQVASPKGVGMVTEVNALLAKVNVHTPDQKPNSAWVFDAEQCTALERTSLVTTRAVPIEQNPISPEQSNQSGKGE